MHTYLGGDEDIIPGEFPRSKGLLQCPSDGDLGAIETGGIYVAVSNVEGLRDDSFQVIVVRLKVKMQQREVASVL